MEIKFPLNDLILFSIYNMNDKFVKNYVSKLYNVSLRMRVVSALLELKKKLLSSSYILTLFKNFQNFIH